MARANRRTHSPVLKGKIHCCFYCGMPNDHREHYVPVSYGFQPYWVPACAECNRFLGNTYDETWVQRFERLYDKYVKKYKSKYLDPDLEHIMHDTTGNLRDMFEYKIIKRDLIHFKLDMLELMKDVLREESMEMFHLSDNLEKISDFLRGIDSGRDVDEAWIRADSSNDI